MNRALRTIIWLVALAGAAFGLFKAYQYGFARQGPVQHQSKQKAEPPLVRVAQVTVGTLQQQVFVTGTVEPDSSARVFAEVAGVLEKFSLPDGTPVEEGGEVQRGDVIAVIEHQDLKAALEEARANLQVARSSVKEARVGLEDAEREKGRMEALYAEGIATEQQRDKAVTAYQSALARLELAEDRAKQAEATLERARLRYEDATVEAPISGVISKKYVDQGSYVNASTPLVKIINIEHVEVQGGVAGKYFPVLRPGQTEVRVEVDAYPQESLTGTVDRVQPELDPVTRTAWVTVRIPNPGRRLKPGMFARIQIVVNRKDDAVIVPDAALIGSGNGYEVFVVNDGRVKRRPVRIGMEEGDKNQVVEGLSAGELVVVRGHHLLEDGIEVRVQKEENAQ